MSFRDILVKVTERKDLTEDEARELADLMFEGNINEIVTSAFLASLKTKGETVDEIVGFASSMRAHALKVGPLNALDTAGTGGDGLGTVNVSTISAIVVSQVYPVAKHGNRAASSKSGSADVLEAFGYNIAVPPELAEDLLKKHNFVFLFAQLYHPAMKNVANVRRTLGIRTIFNVLGPLTNPAGVKRQMTGVFSPSFMERIALAGVKLGYDRMLLVHGEPGLDEVSPCGKTYVYEVEGNKVESYAVDFSEFLKEKIPIERLTVKDSKDSAIRSLRALYGKDKEVREFIRINTAFALYASGVAKDLRDGFELSAQLMDTASRKLYEIVEGHGDVSKLKTLMAEAGISEG
ncbi:MAG: anthranilate phosphoribosyltransferase [Candidatus Aramenus sp.]|nr:anthranilate phosphoribosyltransferase [Candidatus Aramenus sp.]